MDVWLQGKGGNQDEFRMLFLWLDRFNGHLPPFSTSCIIKNDASLLLIVALIPFCFRLGDIKHFFVWSLQHSYREVGILLLYLAVGVSVFSGIAYTAEYEEVTLD